jgi:hypothetical protein
MIASRKILLTGVSIQDRLERLPINAKYDESYLLVGIVRHLGNMRE